MIWDIDYKIYFTDRNGKLVEFPHTCNEYAIMANSEPEHIKESYAATFKEALSDLVFKEIEWNRPVCVKPEGAGCFFEMKDGIIIHSKVPFQNSLSLQKMYQKHLHKNYERG